MLDGVALNAWNTHSNSKVTSKGPTKLLNPDPRFNIDTASTLLSGTIAGNKAERGAYAATPIENNIFILLFKFTCIKISIWPNLSLT